MADLGAAHRDLDITDDQVTAVLAHLEAALGDAGVDPELQRQAMSIVARLWFARVF
jgi:truncated hemoglobin YjbI